MRFLYDLVNEKQIFPFTKATEAEDITDETTANTDSMMGRDTGASTTTRSTTSDNDGDIDMDTDNILGDSGDVDTPKELDENTPEGEDASGDENLEGDDTTGEGDPLGDDTEGGDDLSNTDDITNSLEETPDNSFEVFRKKKLHAQYLALYDTLDTDIRLLAENLPNVHDSLAFNTLSNVNNNLTQCKDYVSKILTEEFDLTEYAILVKKYVALNRVYDIAIKILEKYFEFKNSDS